MFYNGYSFSAKAFVTPSNVTRQSFDDIGFIIVLSNDTYTRAWATIDIYNERRTDDTYYWFAEYLRIRGPGDHIAVGWTVHKVCGRQLHQTGLKMDKFSEQNSLK